MYRAPKRFNLLFDLGIIAVLILVLFATYGQVKNYTFLNYTNKSYFINDEKYKQPLTRDTIRQIFSPKASDTYQPIVRLSHLIDYALFADKAGRHHLTNLGLHIINVCLLFFLLRIITGSRWRSYLISACFALHPLNVEAVAWIAARAQLLGALFMFLTISAYLYYIKKTSIARYLLFLICLSLGLMSDMSLSGLPLLLLLLDVWPFGRLNQAPFVKFDNRTPQLYNFKFLFKEKAPPIVLSILFVAFNLWSTKNIRIFQWPKESFFTAMFDYSLNGYLHYLGKMIWPLHLKIFYPYPEPAAGIYFGLACLATGGFIVFAAFQFKRFPYLLVGFGWYVLLLILSLWFADSYNWALADHHAYLPLIGMFICIIWAVNSIIYKWKIKPVVTLILGAIICLGSATLSWNQIRYWKRDIILLNHAIKNEPVANRAHYLFGLELEAQDQIGLAASHYMQYLQTDPDNSDVRLKLCHILMKQGRVAETIGNYQILLDKDPLNALVHNLMGIALEKQGNLEAANQHYKAALEQSPENADAYYYCGNIFLANHKTSKAINYFLNALSYDPSNENVYYKLGRAYIRKSQSELAIRYFQMALQIKPDYLEAHYQRGIALLAMGRIEEAVKHFAAVINIDASNYDAHTQWGIALALRGHADEAINHFMMALRIQAKDISARNNLQIVKKAAGDIKHRIAAIKKRLQRRPNNPELCYRLGRCYYKIGELNPAEAQLKKVLIIQPEFTPALYELADLYTEIESYSQAITLYRNFLIRRPDFTEAYYRLAGIYGLRGDRRQAHEWLEKAINKGFKDWSRILITPGLKNIHYDLSDKERGQNNFHKLAPGFRLDLFDLIAKTGGIVNYFEDFLIEDRTKIF